MSDNPEPFTDAARELASALQDRVPCLKSAQLEQVGDLPQRSAEAMSTIIELIKNMELMISSQLEILGKSNPQIKAMAETLERQGLLNIEANLQAVLTAKNSRMTRLSNYAELLLRWWSAINAGVQTTIQELPHELTESLNPANWDVEKTRWNSEEAAYWDHYKFVIKHELPLTMGDTMKSTQAEKTLNAYSILGKRDNA